MIALLVVQAQARAQLDSASREAEQHKQQAQAVQADLQRLQAELQRTQVNVYRLTDTVTRLGVSAKIGCCRRCSPTCRQNVRFSLRLVCCCTAVKFVRRWVSK